MMPRGAALTRSPERWIARRSVFVRDGGGACVVCALCAQRSVVQQMFAIVERKVSAKSPAAKRPCQSAAVKRTADTRPRRLVPSCRQPSIPQRSSMLVELSMSACPHACPPTVPLQHIVVAHRFQEEAVLNVLPARPSFLLPCLLQRRFCCQRRALPACRFAAHPSAPVVGW